MKALICTLVLLLLLSSVALADRSARPTSAASTGITSIKVVSVEVEGCSASAAAVSRLITIIKVKISFWFGIDLFGDPNGGDNHVRF